jgi:hypothetical protein
MRLLLVLLFFLTACESDATKLSMLRADYFTADMLSQAYARKLDSVLALDKNRTMVKPLSARARAYGDSLHDWRIKKDLAERDLNRFMH